MKAKGMMYSDIEALEEKLQSLKLKIGKEEFEEISKQLAEIKRLGIELPDTGYITSVNHVIKKIVGLEVDRFSEKEVKESVKEIKRDGFLSRLEYIKLCIKNGKEAGDVIDSAREYWNSIRGAYDEFEAAEVERKLDEVTLEEKLRKIQATKEVDLGDVSSSNYFVVREKLQEILTNGEADKETQLLIKSWLAESIDSETGKIDIKAVEKLMGDKKVWEVLAGVKRIDIKRAEEIKPEVETKALIPGEESESRKRQIEKLSELYGIPLKKFDFSKKKFKEKIFIVKRVIFGKPFYSLASKEYSGERDTAPKIVAVIFNNDVTEIRHHECNNMRDLEYVVLPDNLKIIHDAAFSTTYRLKSLTLPKTLTEIGEYAFYQSGLTSVEIPGSVTTIDWLAFGRAENLEEVKLNEGLECIGARAFWYTKLRDIEIPGSVRTIGAEAFVGNSLRNVQFNEGLDVIWDSAFENNKLETVTLPETVKAVGKNAFRGNTIKNVVIPKGTNVGEGAFVQYDIFKDGEKPSFSSHVKVNQQANLDEKISVRNAVAAEPKTPIEVLLMLADMEDPATKVRRLEIENEKLRKELEELKSKDRRHSKSGKNNDSMDR